MFGRNRYLLRKKLAWIASGDFILVHRGVKEGHPFTLRRVCAKPDTSGTAIMLQWGLVVVWPRSTIQNCSVPLRVKLSFGFSNQAHKLPFRRRLVLSFFRSMRIQVEFLNFTGRGRCLKVFPLNFCVLLNDQIRRSSNDLLTGCARLKIWILVGFWNRICLNRTKATLGNCVELLSPCLWLTRDLFLGFALGSS